MDADQAAEQARDDAGRRRLDFGGRRREGRDAGSAPDGSPVAAPRPPRRHEPVDDVLARMAGKIGERRRGASRGPGDDASDESAE